MATSIDRLKGKILQLMDTYAVTDPANIAQTRDQVAQELATAIVDEIKSGTVTVAGVQPGGATVNGTIA